MLIWQTAVTLAIRWKPDRQREGQPHRQDLTHECTPAPRHRADPPLGSDAPRSTLLSPPRPGSPSHTSPSHTSPFPPSLPTQVLQSPSTFAFTNVVTVLLCSCSALSCSPFSVLLPVVFCSLLFLLCVLLPPLHRLSPAPIPLLCLLLASRSSSVLSPVIFSSLLSPVAF